MEFDYSKLHGKIVEVYGSNSKFSKHVLKLSKTSFSKKMNSKVAFKQKEILKCCSALNIRTCDIGSYFFTLKV